jgi:hypothetical protein
MAVQAPILSRDYGGAVTAAGIVEYRSYTVEARNGVLYRTFNRRRFNQGGVGFALLLLILDLHAADQTQQMTARLSEEADAFRRIAPSLLGHETLEQKAHKPQPRFRPRIGNDAKTPPVPKWQDRQVVSEYGFASFAGETETLHELRRVVSVDGKSVADAKKAEDSLARIIALKDDQREKELLKEFANYGLVGAAMDFGPLLMLFTPREIEHYEFAFKGPDFLGATKALVFRYTQIDGPELLTVFETSGGKPHRLKVQGDVWVRADNFLPLRITLGVGEGQGAKAVHEEASVDYAPTAFGTLAPSSVDHKELRGGQLVMQNSFIYSDFHKFGADAQIQFGNGK